MARGDEASPAAGKEIPRHGLRRVAIKDYKSIGHCDVRLSGLCLLVGRNGSGKSNFLDALRFVSDALLTSLDHALKARGGVAEVRRRSTGHPRNFALALELALADGSVARYSFEIAARRSGGFGIRREALRIAQGSGETVAEYRCVDGELRDSTAPNMPPVPADRLYLVTASGLPAFRGAYDALVAMGFYSLNPDTMRELQSPDAGELLHRDGGNVASVVARLGKEQPRAFERVRDYLASIVPGIAGFEREALGPRETLLFRQRVVGAQHPWKFYASSMSDGTLRALGALVAVSQLSDGSKPVWLVGIEEPETALHPAAAAALMEALRGATGTTQVLVTSHSPDLLDALGSDLGSVLAVVARDGTTVLAPVDRASRRAVREHLYSAGDLLRMDQLEPDPEDVRRQEQEQPGLFPDD